ncbi:MAG TPA: ATP-binding protein [Saprospiraceae bacterium]|nr:ATP-binding protein [Saprospiraceae bacterium]
MALYYLRYILAISCLLLLFLLDIKAQEVEIVPLEKHLIKLSYWKESNGLPTWHINEIIQDNRGLVWLGTETGLYSLDGSRFNHHILTAGKNKTPYIKRIIQDAYQNLWLFCTTSKGIFDIVIYNPFQDESYTLKEYTGSDITFSIYTASTIYEKEGNIYMLDNYAGFAGYFGPDRRWHETGKFVADKPLKNDIFLYKNQLYWALDLRECKLVLQNAEGEILRNFEPPQKIKLLDFRLGYDGGVYLSYFRDGNQHKRPELFRCDSLAGFAPVPESEKYHMKWRKLSFNGFRIPPVWANNAWGINLNKKKDHSIDVFDHETLIYPGLEQLFKKKEIIGAEFRIFTLPDGSFWMVGLNTLIRIEVTPNYFSNLFKDLEKKPSTRGIAIDQYNLYVNSYSGLLVYNLKTQKTRLFENIEGRGLLLHKGKLWSGSHSPSVYLTEQKKTKKYTFNTPKFSGEPQEIYISPNESVYVGLTHGLFYLPPGESEFQKIPEVSGATFHPNADGLWVGGSKGLWLLDSLNNPIRHFTQEFTIHENTPYINHIHEDKEGIFWLATDNGLIRWKPYTQEVKIFDNKTYGLLSNIFYAVYEDNHQRLWIPSQTGLVCYDKKKGDFFTYTHLNGLPGNEFNRLSHYQDETGKLYFGGVSGMISINPDSITKFPVSHPNIQLISLQYKLNGTKSQAKVLTQEAIYGQGPILIPNGADLLEVSYCVPSFLREPIQYRWRIPEIDTNWHYLIEPKFTVYRLPFGKYSLELGIYFPGNGTEHAYNLIIPLQVERPFYLKSWFIAGAIFSIVCAIVLFFRWRQRRLKQLSQLLVVEVAEKTAQLKRERDIIAQQKETLQELNQEKNRFFQDLSHEFRNPLTLILGPTNDLLKHEALPTDYRPRLEQVRKNAKKILHLIEEVLELSKLESGSVPVEKVPIPLPDFLLRICSDFEGAAAHKNISLQLTHTIPSGLTILADGRKLEKILINLIQNALKYTHSGGSVRVNAQWTPHGILDIWVNDTGIGIAPEHLDRIFERFYQVSSNGKAQNKGGFGIGLSLCKHYATLMGGHISVYSTEGVGTDMHLTIPCETTSTKALPTQESKSLETTFSSEQGNKKCILLVDDQLEILEYISDLLAKEFHVLKAGSGEEAIEILKQSHVDVIISDFMMNGMSGLEFLTKVRQDTLLADIPFVLLTGLNTQQFQEEALQLKVNGIFSKPIQETAFMETVFDIINNSNTN